LQTIPRSGSSGGKSEDEVLEGICDNLLNQLPQQFNIEDVNRLKPVVRENSMNTVITQDVLRYNRLIERIYSTVNKLKRAINGLEIMDKNLDKLATELMNNQVPSSWKANSISYPTMKNLGFYFKDLLYRLKIFKDWIYGEQPKIFWLPMFHFTHGFLTGILQN